MRCELDPYPYNSQPLIHGSRQVLASGTGTWDGSIVNANNPQRRDVQILPAKGYIVSLALGCSRLLTPGTVADKYCTIGPTMGIRQPRCLAIPLPYRLARVRWSLRQYPGATCRDCQVQYPFDRVPKLQRLGFVFQWKYCGSDRLWAVEFCTKSGAKLEFLFIPV